MWEIVTAWRNIKNVWCIFQLVTFCKLGGAQFGLSVLKQETVYWLAPSVDYVAIYFWKDFTWQMIRALTECYLIFAPPQSCWKSAPKDSNDKAVLHTSLFLFRDSTLFDNKEILSTYLGYGEMCQSWPWSSSFYTHKVSALSSASDIICWAKYFALLNYERIKLVFNTTSSRRWARIFLFIVTLSARPGQEPYLHWYSFKSKWKCTNVEGQTVKSFWTLEMARFKS